MSRRVERHLHTLQTLAHASASVRKSVINNASKDLVLALVECARNVVQGRVALTAGEFKRLRRYNQQLKRLLKASSTEKSKRGVLVQNGGFLGALLRPILGLLLK